MTNFYNKEELLESAIEIIDMYIGEIETDEDREEREARIAAVPSVVNYMCNLNRELTKEDVDSFKSDVNFSREAKELIGTFYAESRNIEEMWED